MSKYRRFIDHGEDGRSDVYDILRAFEVTDPALQHAIKKLLMPGARVHKDRLADLTEAAESLQNAIQHEKKMAPPKECGPASDCLYSQGSAETLS